MQGMKNAKKMMKYCTFCGAIAVLLYLVFQIFLYVIIKYYWDPSIDFVIIPIQKLISLAK
jgi:hypothetical protein